jgi:hypothetical protein
LHVSGFVCLFPGHIGLIQKLTTKKKNSKTIRAFFSSLLSLQNPTTFSQTQAGAIAPLMEHNFVATKPVLLGYISTDSRFRNF